MPTYEFRCEQGHAFDRFFRTMSAAPMELPCPECGQIAARQMSGGAGLLFKGSGFYLTDYGKNAHRKDGESKKSDGGGEGKSGKAESGEGAKTEGGKGANGGNAGRTADVKKSDAKPQTSNPKPPPKAE